MNDSACSITLENKKALLLECKMCNTFSFVDQHITLCWMNLLLPLTDISICSSYFKSWFHFISYPLSWYDSSFWWTNSLKVCTMYNFFLLFSNNFISNNVLLVIYSIFHLRRSISLIVIFFYALVLIDWYIMAGYCETVSGELFNSRLWEVCWFVFIHPSVMNKLKVYKIQGSLTLLNVLLMSRRYPIFQFLDHCGNNDNVLDNISLQC